MFIVFNDKDDNSKIVINVKNINTICNFGDKTAIYMNGSSKPFYVNFPIDEVIKYVKKALQNTYNINIIED